MTDYLGATLLAIGFVLIVRALRLIDHAQSVLALSGSAMKTMGDAALSDDEKEAALQRMSIGLFRLFLIVTLGAVAALGLPVAGIWLLDKAHLFSLDGVLAATLSWPFLLGATLLGVLVYLLVGRKKRVLPE